jgi:choline dehydrogenase
VLPAFKRLERDLDFGDAPYHGDAGPISIRRYPHEELLPQHQAFLESARALGYPDCPDQNDPWAYGSAAPITNLAAAGRAIGYLAPAREADLTIQANTFVRRLIIEGRRCTA